MDRAGVGLHARIRTVCG